MNDETTVPVTAPSETVPETTIAETTIATTAATVPATEETTAPTEAVPETTVDYYIPETHETIILETFAEIVETTEPIYIDVIETTASDIVHASLFGSFLICGTLVGLYLIGGFHGN